MGPTPLDSVAQAQACLPLRLGGCGIKDPLLIRIPARITGILSYLRKGPELGFHPTGALANLPSDFSSLRKEALVILGQNFEPLKTWESEDSASIAFNIDALDDSHLSQRWWSNAWYLALRRFICSKATLRDKCR